MRRSLAALALAVVLPLPALLPSAVLAGVVVKPGETLSEIADRNGISLKRLMQANGITNPDVVTAGQTLVIPGSGSGNASRSYGSSGRSSGGGTITVQEGDTLSEIADRAGISVNRLMRLNGLSDANKLSIGQKLVVGGSGGGGGYGRQAAAPKPLPTAPYTVKKGETVSELAERFGTTTNRLLELNNISDPKLLVAGTRIAIPGRPSSTSASSRAASSGAGGSSTANASSTREHVVASGESLSHIADRYNTSVERLVAINKISDPDLVVAGTRLKLQAPPAPKPKKPPATSVQTQTHPQTGQSPCGQTACCRQANPETGAAGCQACSTHGQANGPRHNGRDQTSHQHHQTIANNSRDNPTGHGEQARHPKQTLGGHKTGGAIQALSCHSARSGNQAHR